MQITVKELAEELEAWAHSIKGGWDSISMLVTEHYYASSEHGELLEPLAGDVVRVIHNNKQRIQRAFRGETEKYHAKAVAMIPAILAALPAERRAKLENPKSVNYLASQAQCDFAAAMSAVLLGCTAASEKLNRAIETLHALIPVTQQFIA